MGYNPENIFAKIIAGDIPCDPVYQDDKVLAFRDIAPAAEVHVLVLPKGSYQSLDDFVVSAPGGDVADFFKTVRDIAHQLGLGDSGYRVIANHGADASQTVPHFHIHILGGQSLGGLLPDDLSAR